MTTLNPCKVSQLQKNPLSFHLYLWGSKEAYLGGRSHIEELLLLQRSCRPAGKRNYNLGQKGGSSPLASMSVGATSVWSKRSPAWIILSWLKPEHSGWRQSHLQDWLSPGLCATYANISGCFTHNPNWETQSDTQSDWTEPYVERNRSNIAGVQITQGCTFWVLNLLCWCNPFNSRWLMTSWLVVSPTNNL